MSLGINDALGVPKPAGSYVRSPVAGVGEVAVSDLLTSQTVTSASPTDLTNLFVTLTTTGRPVAVQLMGVSSGVIAIDGNGGAGTFNGVFTLYRDGVALYSSYCGTNSDGGTPTGIQFMPNQVSWVDYDVPEGIHTYKVTANKNGTATNINVALSSIRLIAREAYFP